VRGEVEIQKKCGLNELPVEARKRTENHRTKGERSWKSRRGIEG
jgi:hypothetical protein